MAGGDDEERPGGQQPGEEPRPSEPSPVEGQAARVVEALRSVAPTVTGQPHHNYVEVFVPREQLEAAARTLKERLGYDYLSMVTAVDWSDRIEVVYLAFSVEHPHGVYLKTNLPREDLPDCPSLTTVWPGAEFQEREVYDLMGINFIGHPDLRRILTENDFPGYPLRKDFRIAPDYVLMRHLQHGAEGQLAPSGGGEEGSGVGQGPAAH